SSTAVSITAGSSWTGDISHLAFPAVVGRRICGWLGPELERAALHAAAGFEQLRQVDAAPLQPAPRPLPGAPPRRPPPDAPPPPRLPRRSGPADMWVARAGARACSTSRCRRL